MRKSLAYSVRSCPRKVNLKRFGNYVFRKRGVRISRGIYNNVCQLWVVEFPQ